MTFQLTGQQGLDLQQPDLASAWQQCWLGLLPGEPELDVCDQLHTAPAAPLSDEPFKSCAVGRYCHAVCS